MSCPPGQARPAPDETGLWWTAALALRSVRSWCHEPVYELDPEPPEHPALSPGLWAGARILDFDHPGLLAGAIRKRGRYGHPLHALRRARHPPGHDRGFRAPEHRPAGRRAWWSAWSRPSAQPPRSWSGFQNG